MDPVDEARGPPLIGVNYSCRRVASPSSATGAGAPDSHRSSRPEEVGPGSSLVGPERSGGPTKDESRGSGECRASSSYCVEAMAVKHQPPGHLPPPLLHPPLEGSELAVREAIR